MSKKKTKLQKNTLEQTKKEIKDKVLKILKIKESEFKNPPDDKFMLYQSVTLFINNMAIAKMNKVPLRTITLNPLLLQNRDKFKKIHPCLILDPTEARYGFPEDSVIGFPLNENGL
jgi:hypothetical protein